MKKTALIAISAMAILGCAKEKLILKSDLILENIKGKVQSITEYKYASSDGEKGQLKFEVNYKYDEAGNQIEKTIAIFPNSGNSTTSRTTYKYNPDGYPVERTDKGVNGELFHKTLLAYDATGNLINTKYYSDDNRLITIKNLKYDSHGNPIEEVVIIGDGQPTKITRKFDPSGKVIEENWYNGDGTLSSKSIVENDENGNPVKGSTYDAQGTLMAKSICEYNYDQQENWIKKRPIVNGEPKGIVERQITYYKQ
jgi:hypothetical protein